MGGNPTSSFINNITLVMYGTHEEPAHYQKSRSYDGIDMKAYKDRAGSTLHRTAGANKTAAKVFEVSRSSFMLASVFIFSTTLSWRRL